MIDEKKKMTAQDLSVGADDGQSISKNSDISITTSKGEINDEVINPQESLEEMYRRIQRMSDPAYLHTVTLDELMDNVFEVKSAVIENLLYTGAYILAGAPKIGKSRFAMCRRARTSGSAPTASGRICGATRFIREQSSILLWKMTKAVCNVGCSVCLAWRGQAPFTLLPVPR